jgi:hypothetical protein
VISAVLVGARRNACKMEERRGYGRLKCQGTVALKPCKVILKAVVDTDPLKSWYLYLIKIRLSVV